MSDLKRKPDGTFGAGVSGCPGGPWAKEAARVREVREALARMDAAALGALEMLLKDGDPKVVVKAVELWARYSLPVPREAGDAASKAQDQGGLLRPEVARELADVKLAS